MRAGVVCDNRRWADPAEPFQALVRGLARLGHMPQVAAVGPWPVFSRLPDVAFVWNAGKGLQGAVAEGLRREGVPVVVMERGFFRRMDYCQLDPEGFGHRASWRTCLTGPAPPEGRSRFFRVWGSRPCAQRKRGGYVLVLCQVPGDAQLADSELHHPDTLVAAAVEAAWPGCEIRVRPHPLSSYRSGLEVEGTLAEAVAGAAFCLTINSNSANEAIAWGCPVVSLGPALYAMAGAALRTSLRELPAALGLMRCGWHADDGHVGNYLYWLACRQYSNAELAEGSVLRRLLESVR
jgi:hypothetical protein